jgi:hypothetical protein
VNEVQKMSARTSLVLCGMLALVATPHASYADSAQRAVNACVKSFVDIYLPDRVVQVHKQLPASGPLDRYIGSYTILLTAEGKTSSTLAQAQCVANRRGAVIVMDSGPIAKSISKADFVVSLR